MSGTILVTLPDTLSYKGPDGTIYNLALGRMEPEVAQRMAFTVALHGWCQKMGDAFAASKDTPMAERTENANRVCANANDGIWAERGGKRLDPVLIELRILAAKWMKAEAARKATEQELLIVMGERVYQAQRRKAEAIVALRNSDDDMPEPDLG